MNLGVSFAPLVPLQILWASLAAAVVLALLLIVSRSRGGAIRVVALLLIALALANPSLTREDRDPLSSVAVVVVDKSPSQNFGERTRQTEEARGGDGVSSIIITSNDFAGAWATRPDGQPMLPMVEGEPRQRELSFRAGVNIVMYTLTGNYKADQVHVPALLERLGQ